jgi:Fungal protein kinase
MAAGLAQRSYFSSTLLDTFLEGTPEVTEKHVRDLYKMEPWRRFIAKCRGGENGTSFTSESSESNEKEFKVLVQCITSLEGLREYFDEPQENNTRRGRIRISHQGNSPMKTWNAKARWLRGNYGSTNRQKELKPNFMTIIVEDAESQLPRGTQRKLIQVAKPQTILPPPDDWKPEQMDDKYCPMVECREPVWECLDLFWELHFNSQALTDAKVYIDCALKAAEALRYQWSRRYIYCFLHCGSMMQLVHFDRSGLMASEILDIKRHTDKFIRCLLGVFRHAPSRLGYPAGKEAAFHKYGPDNRLLQVVTVDSRQLYIKDQEAGPLRDRLVSRATVAFKAQLVHPKGREKTGWDWCYKSSWPQRLRKHEGDYLERVQGLPNVVELLGYGVVEVENDNDDTTVFGRGQCSSGEPMTLLETFYNRAKRMIPDFTQHTRTEASGQEDLKVTLYDPRRPKAGLLQNCDDMEHRDIVTAWVSSSFDEAVSSLASLSTSTILSIWHQAFSAIRDIAKEGIIHRDISFRNVRVDDEHNVKVCDFDMAMSLDDQGTGVQDRTGTIAFMATSILCPVPYTHRPIHDCESIFWLCALELLERIGSEQIKMTLANIMSSGNSLTSVADSKLALVMRLSGLKSQKDVGNRGSYVILTPKDSPLFFCLTALMREFHADWFVSGYEDAKEEIDSDCFDRCIDIIQKARDAVGAE